MIDVALLGNISSQDNTEEITWIMLNEHIGCHVLTIVWTPMLQKKFDTNLPQMLTSDWALDVLSEK